MTKQTQKPQKHSQKLTPLGATIMNKRTSLKLIRKTLLKILAITSLATGVFGQSVNAADLKQAPYIDISMAQSYFSSITDTVTDGLSGDRSETTPYTLQSLARSLGADRTADITDAEYRTRVFEYVRDNVETLPYYGVKKGALGAYYDGEGTPFDQAMLMVELIEQRSGLTADYVLGTTTLDATQWGNMFGSTNANYVSYMLTDGGIASTGSVSGGNISSVTMDYIWVSSGGTDYDVAYKKHTVEAGIDIGSAMSGGGTTYSRANFQSDVDMQETHNGTVLSYHGPDVTAAENNLQDYATNLVTAFKDTHYQKSMDEIIGGRYLNPEEQASLTPGTLSTPHKTISGDIPNEYRTALRIQYGNIDKTIYADEIYGLRLWMDGNDLRVGNATIATNGGTATTMTLSVNHPYAMAGGTYADHSETFDISDLSGAAIVFATGRYSNQAARHVVNDDYQDSIVNDNDAPDAQTMAKIALAANWQVQFGQLMTLNGALASVNHQHHDTIGVIVSDSNDNITVDIDTNMSVNADTGDNDERRAAFSTLQSANNVFKSSLIDQANGEDVRSAASMMVEAMSDSAREIQVIMKSNPNVIDNLTSYDSGLRTAIKNDLNSNPSHGNFYLMVDDISGLSGSTDAEPYVHLLGDSNLILDHYINDTKGAYGTSSDIATAGDLLGGIVGDIIRDNSPQAVSGEYSETITDYTTGSGDFPRSLPYTRSYQHSRRDAPDKGWMHNYDITANKASNSLIALSNPIAAAQAIATLKVINDINVNDLNFTGTLTSLIAENWLRKELIDNTFTVRTAGGSDVYYKLADGNYEALSGSLATLNKTGTGNSTVYTITALSESEMIFEYVDDDNYRIEKMTWPNGIELDFEYTTYSASYPLLKVRNSFNRELAIYDSGAGWVSRLGGSMPRVDYTYPQATLDKVEISTSSDSETLWLGDQNYNGTTHKWEIERFIATDTTTAAVTHTLNRLGQLEKTVDRENNTSRFYPSQRRGETVGNTGGVSTTYTNHQGLTYKAVNALGQEARSTFYGNGLGKRATTHVGNAVEYTYDKYGQKLTERVYANDGAGGTDEAEYLETTYTYDTLANQLQLLTVTTPDLGLGVNHNVTTYEYETSGTFQHFLKKVKLPSVDVWDPVSESNSKIRPETLYAYKTETSQQNDTLKLLDTVTAPDGTVTKTDYELDDVYNRATGHVAKVTRDYHATAANGLNRETHYLYNSIGDFITTTDQRALEFNREYNLRRQVTKTWNSTSQEPRWIGDTFSYVTKTYGNMFYIYDDAGRITRTYTTVSDEHTEYDDLGRVHKRKDADLDTTTYNYTENLGSPITVSAPTGFTDPVLVSMVEVVDPMGRKARSYSDILGRAIRTVTAADTVDEYTEERGYNDAGQLAWVRDGNGNVTEYTYDNYGRAVRTIYPDDARGADANYTESSNYDDNGQPGTLRKRDGSTFTLSYDSHGRIIQRIVKSSGGITERTYDFGFDIMGRSIYAKVTKGSDVNEITMSYDAIGRKLSEIGDDGYGTTYEYDDEKSEVEITYDDPGTDTYKVKQRYSARGELIMVIENRNGAAGKRLAAFTNDLVGRMTQSSRGNTRTATYTHEDDGDLTQVRNFLTADASADAIFTYTHNAAGQVTSKDATEDLYKWTPSQNIENDYTINTLNQATNEATSIDGGAVTNNTVTWDNNGNMSAKGNRSFTWSIENYLEQVDDGASTTATYKYDAMGRRISKTVGSTTTNYIYDGGNVIAEYTGSTLLRRYAYGARVDMPIAMITPNGSNVDREYYYFDAQGSVIATLDDAENITASYTYDPYGKTDDLTGNVYRYTGRRLDFETGLYYYRARYYDPDMGRFLSADPIGYGDGLNMYAYVGNDPVNKIDPTGTDEDCPGCSSVSTAAGLADSMGYLSEFGGRRSYFADMKLGFLENAIENGKIEVGSSEFKDAIASIEKLGSINIGTNIVSSENTETGHTTNTIGFYIKALGGLKGRHRAAFRAARNAQLYSVGRYDGRITGTYIYEDGDGNWSEDGLEPNLEAAQGRKTGSTLAGGDMQDEESYLVVAIGSRRQAQANDSPRRWNKILDRGIEMNYFFPGNMIQGIYVYNLATTGGNVLTLYENPRTRGNPRTRVSPVAGRTVYNPEN